ncbi:MLPputative-like protein [Hibiscus syriacus]|uniref:MLPputative-like protein n=1 Tax=Hibiscus syriacus TaxID=106335 RepID=A0A6A3BQM1_HIBSY|nr:norbelladine synthase-like [Hibiscus syriacus]KAE8717718.1 MLPputative-like protein [Hibiscus syriacus]
MHGQISSDTPVGVPAALIWDVYRGLELGRLVDKIAPDVLGRVEFLEGDGGVGTIAKLTFPPAPGSAESVYMKEKFTKIDDENLVKETEIIEGGYKALGFNMVRVRLEIIEKDSESCIVRSSIEYEGDDKLEDVVSHVSVKPLETMAEIIGKHLSEYKSTQ